VHVLRTAHIDGCGADVTLSNTATNATPQSVHSNKADGTSETPRHTGIGDSAYPISQSDCIQDLREIEHPGPVLHSSHHEVGR
jgi:hypothetical protein